MSGEQFAHYLPTGMADTVTPEQEVRHSLMDAAQRFIRRLERGPISFAELESASRTLIDFIAVGKTTLMRHADLNSALEHFRAMADTHVPDSQEDVFRSE
jgi:hypothetical protein